jgi:hypothetical protein
MSKPIVPEVLKAELPDPTPAAEARRRAFLQAQDSCPQRGGMPGRLKKTPGNH